MKHKLLVSMLTVACASCFALGLAACKDGDDITDNKPNPTPDNGPTYVVPEENEDTRLAYSLNAGGTYTITGLGEETKLDIVIPSKIGDIAVTEIAPSAFSNKSALTKIFINEGVTTIGEKAFLGCSGLKSISLPNSVTSVGESAFQGCGNLIGVSLGSGLTSIADSMFLNCTNIKGIVIPDGVKTIGESAFQGCTKLTDIEMGVGVATIESRAFQGCTGLIKVSLGEGVKMIGNFVFANCTSLNTVIIPNSVRFIGTNLLMGCTDIKTISVPFTGAFRYKDAPANLNPDEGVNVEDPIINTNIDKDDPTTYANFGYFFGSANITENNDYTNSIANELTVIITDSEVITENAFYNVWRVTTVIIQGNLKELEITAFGLTWELKTIVLPKSLTKVDSLAFLWTPVNTVYYEGTAAEYNSNIGNGSGELNSCTKYYYSEESQPGCWHYDENGMPTLW